MPSPRSLKAPASRRTGPMLRPICLALTIAISTAQAMDTDAPPSPPRDAEQRPTIGLVLAGGGARGFAHIGVIKVMEEARIPVDYITGTSMGSIIGALYAAGMSPEEMETALRQIDWATVVSDKPDRQHMSFRRKEDDGLALLPFEVGIGPEGITPKPGIFAASKIEFAFRILLLDTMQVASFDDLRIPYRAMGTDLVTGEAVILDHGDLPRAMRASMAIPGVFTPVVIDGRVLIDGGLADNMPVGVARNLGAQRIIAVDVGTPPLKDVSRVSAFGVVSQTIDILSENNVEAQRALLGNEDLLITPDLEGLSAADFGKFEAALAAGEAAARRLLPQLASFAVGQEEFDAFLARQRRGTMMPEVSVDAVRVEVRRADGTVEDSPVLARRIESTKGPIDAKRVGEDLLRLTQAGEYETPGFRIEEREGVRELVLHVDEKSNGPVFLRFGIGIEADFSGTVLFSATTVVRLTDINRLGAEWKTILSIGNPGLIHTEFYQPLEKTGFWFTAPYAAYARDRLERIIPGGDTEVIERQIAETGLDVGVQLRNWAEIRLGYLRGRAEIDAATTSPLEGDTRAFGAMRFHGTIDQVDNIFFPTRGNYTDLDLRVARDGFGSDDDYELLRLRCAQAWSWRRNTFVGNVRVTSDLGSELPPYARCELGGFMNLSGLQRGSLRGEVCAVVSLVDYWRISRLAEIGNLYVGLSIETGGAWDDLDDAERDDLVHAGLLFLGVDTKHVPIYIGFGLAEGGESAGYIYIGRAFL